MYASPKMALAAPDEALPISKAVYFAGNFEMAAFKSSITAVKTWASGTRVAVVKASSGEATSFKIKGTSPKTLVKLK